MENARIENQSGTYPVSVGGTPPAREGDVTLAGLLCIVIRRRVLVLSILLACLLAAGGYLALKERIYQASAHLLPPQQLHIQGLLVNYGDIDELENTTYTSEFVYKSFLDNLKSQGLRREFFDREQLLGHYLGEEQAADANVDRVFKEKFDNNLQVRVNRTDPSFVSISFSVDDPVFASDLLNRFIDFVNRRTIDQLVNGVNATLMAEIAMVRQQMASKLKLAEQRRLDSVIKLKEALRIATTLGIKDTTSFPKVTDRAQAGLAVNIAQVPLYMRGTEALETEIKVLESRKSNEPFIGGFRDLQERRAFLESVIVDRDSLSAVTIDAAATPPYRQKYPRYWSTMLLAGLLGLLVSLMAAFFAEFVSTVKNEMAEPS